MNILMVNAVHPSTPHISGVRAWRFASELATLGHRVVLITASKQQDSSYDIEGFDSHEWTTPFILSCRMPSREASVDVRLPQPLPRIATALKMLTRGGRHGEWAENAVDAAEAISQKFGPRIVWCTFGTLEGVMAARRIASRGKCPWVLDLKDNWELYVPAGMRTLMAWRTRGWVGLTANARFTAEKAMKWHGAEATVVYSGVDDSFSASDEPDERLDKTFSINLIGSIYNRTYLDEFLCGLSSWIKTLSTERKSDVALRYLGADARIVQEAVCTCAADLNLVVSQYLPVHEMARLCRTAAINAYVTHPATFHHKLLELLSCGAPVIAYPRESAESRCLARELNQTLIEAADAAQLASQIASVHSAWLTRSLRTPPSAGQAGYSWPRQAKLLETRLLQLVPHS
jgi:hypothetical protein